MRAPSLTGFLALSTLLPVLGGCMLEKVTGQEVPLDPRFYKAAEASQCMPGVGGGSSVPFSSDDRPRVTLRGVLESPLDMAVDLDIRVPDAKAPGGMRGEGKVLLEGPGPFELEVPADLRELELQAFQDEAADGPTSEDHFGQLRVTVGDEDQDLGSLALVQGARSGGPQHTEAPPGAPGGAPGAPDNPAGQGGAPMGEPGQGGAPLGEPGQGGAPLGEPGQAGEPGQPGEPTPAPPGSPGGSPVAGGPPGEGGAPGGGGMKPFSDHSGPWVTLRGTLGVSGDGVVDLDLFQPASDAPGGRRMLGKLRLDAGPFEVEVPAGFGPVILEAFVDKGGDGPGMGDPMGTYPGNPLTVGRSDIEGVDIALSVPEDGKMPRGAGRP